MFRDPACMLAADPIHRLDVDVEAGRPVVEVGVGSTRPGEFVLVRIGRAPATVGD